MNHKAQLPKIHIPKYLSLEEFSRDKSKITDCITLQYHNAQPNRKKSTVQKANLYQNSYDITIYKIQKKHGRALQALHYPYTIIKIPKQNHTKYSHYLEERSTHAIEIDEINPLKFLDWS